MQPADINFKSLFESAPGLYLVLLPDLTIVAVSDAYLQATMTKRKDILGRGLFDVFPDNPNDPSATGVSNLRASLDYVLEHGKAHAMAVQKYDIRRPDGGFEERFWSPLNTPILNKKKKIDYIIHQVEDVTEMKRLKNEEIKQTEEIRKANKKFTTIFNVSPVALCITRIEDGRFLYANDVFCKTLGFKKEELIGKKSTEVNIIDAGEREKIIQQIQKKGGYVKNIEIKLRKATGEMMDIFYSTEKIEIDNEIAIATALVDITQRKRAEEEIKNLNATLEKRVEEKTKEVIAKEKQYRFLLQNMREGIQVIGHDWRYLFVNSSVVQQSKNSSEELLGHTMMAKYPGIEYTEMFKVLQRCMKERCSEIIENEFTFPDGVKEYYELSIQPVPEGLFILSMDITERKKTENDLTKSLKEISDYKYALDESSIVAITDQKGIIMHVNDNFCKISKYSREELIGQDHRIINSGYHPKEFIGNLWTTIANGKIWKGELKNKAKDGTFYWVDTTIVPFLNEKGKPYQYIAIRSDITQRKKSEEEVLKSENRFRSIIEQFPFPVVTYNPDGTYTNANKAWEIMWQYKREDVKGYNIRTDPQMTASGLSVHVEKAFAGELAASEPYLYDPVLIGHNSPKRWMQMTLYPLKDEHGTILEVILVLQDVTENKEAEEKLRKYAEELQSSNTELERFAYVASHDLQEPLRMVSSFLNLLEKRIGGQLDEDAKRYIDFAVDGATRMKTLIQDLLQYSRVGSNKENFAATHLNEVMKYMIRLLEETIKKDQAVITVKPMPIILANKTLISQLFVNLVNNALKFHGNKKPEIEIGYTEEPDKYTFYVKDNGIGVEPKFFDKIFIIFQRLHSKSEYSGTGIGLAICKKIVEIHKGKIWLESELGKGSTFYFSIPKYKI